MLNKLWQVQKKFSQKGFRLLSESSPPSFYSVVNVQINFIIKFVLKILTSLYLFLYNHQTVALGILSILLY